MLPLSHRRRKEIASLQHRKYRDRLGQVLVEGVRSVEAAAEAGVSLVDVVVTAAAAAEARVQALLATLGVPVYLADARTMAALSDVETSQGLLAVARLPSPAAAPAAGARAVLALDGVQDPGNVGTLLRTAAWLGVEAVLAGAGTADVYSPKVVRAAMGGLWDLAVERPPELAAALAARRAQGWACYGADLSGTPLPAWRPRHPSVLVVGSEAHGLSAAVAACLDERVVIPGGGARRGVESLNVAVAGGILAYAWLNAP